MAVRYAKSAPFLAGGVVASLTLIKKYMQLIIPTSLVSPGSLFVQVSVSKKGVPHFLNVVKASGCHLAAANPVTPQSTVGVYLVVAPIAFNLMRFQLLYPPAFN